MTKARHLLLIGNSVSGPPAPGILPYPDRLAASLGAAARLTTIIRSGATIDEIEPAIAEALAARPDAVILQVGINECAPRPLGPRGRRRLGTLRPLWARRLIIRALHLWRPQIIRVRPLAQLTPLDCFAASIARVVDGVRRAGSRLLILPITEVTPVAERRTPFTNREVGRYNSVLRAAASDRVRWVEVAELLPGLTPADYCHTPDTVHWSPAAHERVAQFLDEWWHNV